MLAVADRGGKIRPQVAVVKSLASAICIGAGGSVGREGPIVQIGSALGSSIGQVLHVSENRLRLLVACGTAAGISATFNAPIAGVFFALELILQDFAVNSFGAVVLASVAADVIGRAAFGNQAFLTLPAFHIVSKLGVRPLRNPRGAGWSCRAGFHPRPLRDRGSPGSHLAWPRMAASGGWWRAPRTPAAGAARALWRRLSGAPKRRRRPDRAGASARIARRQDARHQPDHRHRRIWRRLRAITLHGRDAGYRVWSGRQHAVPWCGRRQPAPTDSSGWAPCSQVRQGHRSPL